MAECSVGTSVSLASPAAKARVQGKKADHINLLVGLLNMWGDGPLITSIDGCYSTAPTFFGAHIIPPLVWGRSSESAFDAVS